MKKYIPIALLAALVVLALLSPFILSKNPEINLETPAGYGVGNLIVLDAEESIAEQLQWTILPETKNFKIVGNTAYFSSPNAIRYTVILSATNGGTLATKVFYLNPRGSVHSVPEPLVPDSVPVPELDPKISKIKKLIDDGIFTTLDEVITSAKQLGIETPKFKTFEEYKQWIDDNS